jgi:hypothetical protein
VVAAATPLKGGEAAHNVTLGYHPDLLQTSTPELTWRLLDQRRPRRLPNGLVHELATYPDWQGAELPGARVAATLLRTLGGAQP